MAERVIAQVGLQDLAATRADTLPTGTARLVELARALATQPRVLLLDEPSSGLSVDETQAMAALLRQLTASGLAVLLVEHDMSFIMDLCADIVVLDAGEVIARGTPSEVQSDPKVLAAYLGTSSENAVAQVAQAIEVREAAMAAVASGFGQEAHPTAAAAAIELHNVSAGYGGIKALFDLDLVVQRGQVCAVLGPNGAGKSTMLKVASGQLAPTSGTVAINGRPIAGISTDRLVQDGVCIVPEGRGIFPNLTVAENLRMATYAGTTSYDHIQEVSFSRFPILGHRRKQLAGTLSGGEQQMLSMARALPSTPTSC